MQHYSLRPNTGFLKTLGLILITPFICGMIVLMAYIDNKFITVGSYLLLALILMKLPVLYAKFGPIYDVTVTEKELVITAKTGQRAKHYHLADIGLVHYEHTGDIRAMSVIMISGKCAFNCTNVGQEQVFYQLFDTIVNKIKAKEEFIYSKKGRGGTLLKRYFYVNPLHQDTTVVQKKIKKGSYYYPAFIIIAFVVLFFIFQSIYNYL